MRTIGVVTVARSDWGYLAPIVRRLRAEPDLRPVLFAAGGHLLREHGSTLAAVEAEGLPVAERIDLLLASDAPGATATALGLGVLLFGQAYARQRPDLVLLLGDRFETFAAAAAAAPLGIPLAHIHGGESTEGAFDELFRHAITKLSHLHFAATAEAGRRLVQMGEDPRRVHVTGSPGLDTLLGGAPRLDAAGLAAALGATIDARTLLVTLHSETLALERTDALVAAVLGALDDVGQPALFTAPNADPGGQRIRAALERFVADRPGRATFVPSLGPAYPSALALAGAMVGNSSSGIIEAASFGLPVVNVGDRQRGRLRARNVIDVEPERARVAEAIRRASSPGFRAGLSGLENPYGDGRAAERIVAVLRHLGADGPPRQKRFYDGPEPPQRASE